MSSKYLNYYKEVLESSTKMSTCRRLHVGAIIVKEGRVKSSGWNGTMPGQPHCNEIFSEEDSTSEAFYEAHGKFSAENEGHAEMSAIAYAAREGVATNGCDMAVSHTPCSACAKVIILAGIKRIYYIEKYDRDLTGMALLEKCGVECIQLP